jgi:UDP:flavonoid glycosyltransferase YjiC (YdhE family)
VRVLFSSTSGYGHIFPMVPLARAFMAAGHDVLWATSADACAHVVAAGVDAAPAGLAGTQLQEQAGATRTTAGALAPEARAAFLFPRMFGATYTPPMVADLLPLAAQWRPDLLIHEHGELASPLVGAVLGLPSVTHAFGGAIPASFVTEAGERLAPLWEAHGQPRPPYAGCFTSLYLDICPSAVQSVSMSHIGATQALRPVHDTGQPPSSLPDYLTADPRPLVYLTMGTVHNHAPLLRPAVEALSALPVRLLVTVGPDGDPAVLGSQPPNVRVERWVPQPQVLEHCTVVASHAGSGTFLGALSNGLPQLCLPLGADQFRNSEGGVRAGAALVLRPAEASPEAIADAVAQLLAQDSFRLNAGRVADDIRTMPSPDEVVEELVRLG